MRPTRRYAAQKGDGVDLWHPAFACVKTREVHVRSGECSCKLVGVPRFAVLVEITSAESCVHFSSMIVRMSCACRRNSDCVSELCL